MKECLQATLRWLLEWLHIHDAYYTKTMTFRPCAAGGQVDEATEFQPLVRGEVGAFAWHYVAHLPASEEASMHYNNTEGARHKFFQVCT